MKVSELIEKLESFKNNHGDIQCITPGYNEYGYEIIGTVEVLSLSKRDFSKEELRLREHVHGLPEYSYFTDTGKFFPDKEEVLNLNF